tara:strand:- start:215 stop:472 length:258 start_codon:yes stop_codon:yes gene_type:complete
MEYSPEQLAKIVGAYEKNKNKKRIVSADVKKKQNEKYYAKYSVQHKEKVKYNYYKKIEKLDVLEKRYPDIYEKYYSSNNIGVTSK